MSHLESPLLQKGDFQTGNAVDSGQSLFFAWALIRKRWPNVTTLHQTYCHVMLVFQRQALVPLLYSFWLA